MKLIVLHRSDGKHQEWSEIDKDKLESLLIDGSLVEGDLIVYPTAIHHVVYLCGEGGAVKND